MSRENVEFNADGTTLRGWFFHSKGANTPRPVVVMAHGMSAVKEMHLENFAEVFASAGLHVLVYDHRNFGASDGQPRQEIDPVRQVRDFRHAITYAAGRQDVDSRRVGIWGTSFSGGHVLSVAAVDRRVKAAVSQVPFVTGHGITRSSIRGDVLSDLRVQLEGERRRLYEGAEPTMFPVVDENPFAPAIMPTADAWEYFSKAAAERAPAWRNEITFSSLERSGEYEPGDGIHRISPTPLLMIVAADDVVTPAEFAFDAYERAREPKQLLVVPGGHFDIYTDETIFATAVAAARDHFVRYLA